MAAPTIVIRLLGDPSQLQGALGRARTDMEKFKTGVQVAGAAVAVGAVTLGKASVEAAATQSANFSKYEQITKKAMDGASKATARGLSLSQADYADYFAQLSAMYQSNGVGTEKANQMAAESMATAADAAAFADTSVGQAVEAQLGLLKGSGELWEQYSVSIKASDISARMKAEGSDKLTGAEKKAAEATVRHSLAQEKAKIFLGQAAKESNSLATRSATLSATLEDLKAKIGEKLLPTVEKVIGKFQSMATWVENNQTKTKAIAAVILSLAGIIAAAAATIAIYNAVQKVARAATIVWTGAMWLLNAAFLGNPIGIIIIAIIALVAIFVVAWKKSETFKRIVTGAFNAIRNAARAVWNWIKSNWPLLLAIITGPIGIAVALVIKMWDRIKAGAKAVWDAIRRGVSGAKDWIVRKFSEARDAALRVATRIRDGFLRIWTAIKDGASKAKDWIVEKFTAAWTFYVGIGQKIRAVFTGLWDAIQSGATAAKDWVVGKAGDIVDFFQDLPGKVGDLSGDLLQLGVDWVQGFIDGIVDKAASIPGIVKDKMVGAAKSALSLGGLFGSPSRLTARYGRWWAEGFVEGISDSKGAVVRGQEMMMEALRAKVDEARDIARGIRDAFRIDLSETSKETPADTMLVRLRKQALAAEAFTKRIAMLRKGGLKSALIEQLVSEGPAALASANEIALNIKEVNRLSGKITNAGSKLANSETRARTGISMTAPNVNVRVLIDGKELRAIARTEVAEANREAKARALAASRR